jgi:hypothetical protein
MSEALTRATGPTSAPPPDLDAYRFDTTGSASPSFQSIVDSLSSKGAHDHKSNDDSVPQPPPDLPGDDGRGDGTAGAVQTVAHQGACAVAGAILGGAGGAIVGGIGEGLAGAGLGTLVEPGGGTIIGGVAGVADGARNGAFLGSAAGAAAGVHLCGGDTSTSPLPSHIQESRSDPGRTQPTGALGGTPTGPRSTSAENARPAKKIQVDSENQVADKLASSGYQTVQNPTEGPNPPLTPERMAAEGLKPGRDPDLLIENRVFDTYTPVKDNAQSVRDGINGKIEARQTHRVVVDLRQTTQTPASVRAALRNKPVRDLREVIFLTKDGLDQPFRP